MTKEAETLFDSLDVIRLMALRLALWDSEFGPEIVEEWSAKLDLSIPQAQAVIDALVARDA